MRDATAGLHDQLDEAMRAASGWDDHEQYADFLALQHSARVGVEEWLDRNAPDDLAPPLQSQLIAADLDALDRPLGDAVTDFALDLGADQSTQVAAFGIGWVLAGSSLGNRAILHELRRKGHEDWPHAFLSDPAMMLFWNRLRPMIETPADDATVEATAHAARATFEHFLGVAGIANQTNLGQNQSGTEVNSSSRQRDPAKQAEAEIQAVLKRNSKSYPAKPQDEAGEPVEVPVVDAPLSKHAHSASKPIVDPDGKRGGPNKRIPV